MTVTLNSINKDPDGDALVSINISNGAWRRAVEAGEEAGIEGSEWDGYHDPVTYSPDTLHGIARVLGDSGFEKDLASDLHELADNGGAELS